MATAVAALAVLAMQLSPQASEASSSSNRQSCSEIAGTRYHSREERLWYEKYCLTAAPVPPVAAAAPVSVSNDAATQFSQGYRQAGGPEQYLSHILYNVIPCESDFDPFAVSYGGPFYGLMQFLPSTWYMTGGGDWFSPWQQGYNTAVLLRSASPGSQWPYCWYVQG